MNKLYIFDLDGTLADLTHRLHFIKREELDWDAFHEACDQDKPVNWVIEMTRSLKDYNSKIVILSGRMDTVRGKTIHWLDMHCVIYDKLIMRPKGDFTPDDELKLRMLKELFSDYPEFKEEDLQFIVDDRQRVVDMWRQNGYNVLQCQAWKE